jgi:hypothetical protein
MNRTASTPRLPPSSFLHLHSSVLIPRSDDSAAIASAAPRRLTLPGFRACCRGNKAGNPVTVLEV